MAANVVASLSGVGDVVYNCIVLLYSAIRMRISITFSVEEMYLVLSKCVWGKVGKGGAVATNYETRRGHIDIRQGEDIFILEKKRIYQYETRRGQIDMRQVKDILILDKERTYWYETRRGHIDNRQREDVLIWDKEKTY